MNFLRKEKNFKIFMILVIAFSMIGLTACGGGQSEGANEKPKLILGDAGWDSFTFHNEVAKIIIENGFGYKTDITRGSTPATFTGLRRGDIDIYMEGWSTLLSDYDEAIESGDIVELSINYDDNAQGFYVPTYMIKGDKERGIKPITPDLKSVQDLLKYPKVFKDEEDPSKGRIYGAIPGWDVDKIMREKIKTYGLDKEYIYFSPGSDSALASSIAAAYEKGEPWVGYYWEPTWITGKYDMTLLEDVSYDEKLWDKGYACAFPPVKVSIAANKTLEKKAPDVVEFLKQYKTSSKITSDALAFMQDNEVEADEAAKWFIKEHEEIWTKWVSDEVANKVKDAVK
ncbi:ABC transporter substrate-binding protein [Inediibacterium massiliense]|uniref:ABC transporter substrate-binding protein n=1 Tax=Inediibacterium massiliense TaxID=1658111 RepID=UPI0006B45CD0|nr:ABC transporter substrate-binding protein [Inediibacterium massiliense]